MTLSRPAVTLRFGAETDVAGHPCASPRRLSGGLSNIAPGCLMCPAKRAERIYLTDMSTSHADVAAEE